MVVVEVVFGVGAGGGVGFVLFGVGAGGVGCVGVGVGGVGGVGAETGPATLSSLYALPGKANRKVTAQISFITFII